jgi:predicted kinase
MLRASAQTPNGPLIVAGISDGNVERLKAGQPIKADLRSFGVNLPGSLVIFHAPTEADMEVMFRKHGLLTDRTNVTVDPKVDQAAEIRARHDRILIATVGLPRSGKSTWAKSQAYPIVNPDAIRLALHGQRFAANAEPFVWATAKVMVRALFGAGHKAVILDATNITRKRRDEWKSKEWGLFFKNIPTGSITCTARAIAEKDEDILPVIERMAAEYEAIQDDEMQWP